jgi:hypothetical protein
MKQTLTPQMGMAISIATRITATIYVTTGTVVIQETTQGQICSSKKSLT